nr:PIN domain-containing protein [Nocardiopsis halotolerans]
MRKLHDCLIAAVALRTDAILVHRDRDFDHLAGVFPRLRVQRHDRN